MKNSWNVTYEIWDEESSEIGETDEKGFVVEDVSFKEALEEVGGIHASYEPDSSGDGSKVRWLTNDSYNEGTHEYFTTGREEQRSLHIPEHITPSSRKRICKLLGVRVR